MALIYLAAPMENILIESIENQYMSFEKVFKENGHELINNFSFYKNDLSDRPNHQHKTNAPSIVEKDLDKLKKSQIILIDFSNENHTYVGCICEMIYAKSFNKKVICIVNNNKFYNHPWIVYHCDAIYNNLDEAINFINQLDLTLK